MGDRLILFREMAKHYARQQGLLATMMPKPFADRTGTGAHFNMSLCELGGSRNLFACAPGEDRRGLGLTELGYFFIGGILRHGRALCAAFAPTVNSYKRLVRQGAMSYFSWAPVFNSYGSNNRTNSVRVPAGGGRCESRNADGSVNPYLAASGGRAGRYPRTHRSGRAERGQSLRHRRGRAALTRHRISAADAAGSGRELCRRSVDRAHTRPGAARRVRALQDGRVGGV